MNAEQAAGFKIRIDPEVVTPECFYRGSTMLTTTLSRVEWVGGTVRTFPSWIPAKGMRE